MASIESRLFYLLLRFINKKKFLDMQFAFGNFNFNNSREPPKSTLKVCNITRRQVNGRNVFILAPKRGDSHRRILYLHGGAYVQSFVRQQWRFLAMLVQSTHCTIIAPDYPLAPKHTYVDAYNFVVPLYKEMIAGAGASNSIVMGDSAGGGFALGLCQKMKLDGVAQPGRIILLSPWLDATLSNPLVAVMDRQDPFLGVSGLRKAGRTYAGDADPGHYMISPINGPLEGLGRISIFVGGREIFAADTRRLYSIARSKGIFIDHREYKEMVHVWMLLYFRESRHAQAEIIQLIGDS